MSDIKASRKLRCSALTNDSNAVHCAAFRGAYMPAVRNSEVGPRFVYPKNQPDVHKSPDTRIHVPWKPCSRFVRMPLGNFPLASSLSNASISNVLSRQTMPKVSNLALVLSQPYVHSAITVFWGSVHPGQWSRVPWPDLCACGEQGVLLSSGKQENNENHVLSCIR